MKQVEDQVKQIKNDYGDRINAKGRAKLQKTLYFAREMNKLQLLKSNDDKPNQEKVLVSLRAELARLRTQIEGQIKLNMTGYQAYIWKLTKITHRDKPAFFSNLVLPQLPEQNQSVSQVKLDINAPLLSMKNKDLIKIATELLITENKFCAENFTVSQISKLVTQISFGYNILPYHHFTHAFSVFLMLFQCKFLSETFGKIFGEFQIFMGAIAALCHDIGHIGTNSLYQAKKDSKIAILYNYESILENMHISQFYQLCRENPDIDIISKMKSPTHRENAKRLLNKLILATDVAGHNKNLAKLKSLSKKDFSAYQQTEKDILLQNIFHGCDVGNPCLDFKNYMNWAFFISEEFNYQAQKQKFQGLDVTPNFLYVDIPTHYNRQIGFINFIVFPIWMEISNILPELQCFTKEIKTNEDKLKALLTQM